MYLLNFRNPVLSLASFDVLQRAQNNLARVVCQRGGRTDARPLLMSLHWLPVIKHRVTYKMVTLTFKTMSSATPAYLSDLIKITDGCSSSSSAVIRRPAADCPKNAKQARSSGIFSRGPEHLHSLPRPTCSDSLNLWLDLQKKQELISR